MARGTLFTWVCVASGLVAVPAAAGSLRLRRLARTEPLTDADVAADPSPNARASAPLRWVKRLWFAGAGSFLGLLFLRGESYYSPLVAEDRYQSTLAGDLGDTSIALALLVLLILWVYVIAGIFLDPTWPVRSLLGGVPGVLVMLLTAAQLMFSYADGQGQRIVGLLAAALATAALATAALTWAAVEARRTRLA